MKLNKDFVLYDTNDEETLAIATGKTAKKFSGFARANEAASSILKYLAEDITEEELVQKMAEEYDAPREVLEEDIRKVLEKLEKIGALDR